MLHYNYNFAASILVFGAFALFTATIRSRNVFAMLFYLVATVAVGLTAVTLFFMGAQ